MPGTNTPAYQAYLQGAKKMKRCEYDPMKVIMYCFSTVFTNSVITAVKLFQNTEYYYGMSVNYYILKFYNIFTRGLTIKLFTVVIYGF